MKALGKIVIVIFILCVGLFAFSKAKELFRPDPAPPVITSSQEAIEVPCDYTDEQILQGLRASSETDGDLTDQIMVGNISRFREKGVSTVTYVVFDSANQPASYTRQVIFSDYRSPEFRLDTPLVFACSEAYGIENYIGATDLIFGDISNAVRFEDNNISFNTAGDYYLTVEASNFYGDTASQQLPVHIVNAEDLAITIQLTQGLVYIDKGAEFSPSDYLDTITASDRTAVSDLHAICHSMVDVQNAGVYEVKYTVNYNGERGVNWLTVIVRD